MCGGHESFQWELNYLLRGYYNYVCIILFQYIYIHVLLLIKWLQSIYVGNWVHAVLLLRAFTRPVLYRLVTVLSCSILSCAYRTSPCYQAHFFYRPRCWPRLVFLSPHCGTSLLNLFVRPYIASGLLRSYLLMSRPSAVVAVQKLGDNLFGRMRPVR